MVWYPGKNIYDRGTIFRFRGWPLTGFGIPMDTHGQTWQQVWRFTINDSWWQKRSNLPFFWFCWEVFITKMGTAMVCLFIMFQFILVSWVCLNKKWIAGYPRFWQGNHRPDHETYIGWNLEWVSTCDRYINGYDMVRLKHWLPMGPTSPCLWTWLGWTLKLWPFFHGQYNGSPMDYPM